MSSDLLTTAFATLERPVDPRPEFSTQLFDRLSSELDSRDRIPARQLRRPTRRTSSRPGRRWSLSASIAGAAATVVALVVVVVGGEEPRAGALEAVNAARARFAVLPPVHVVYTVHRELDHPDLESATTYDVWYADPTHWRSTVVASNARMEKVGDFRVTDGTVEAEYSTNTHVFDVRRIADVPGPVIGELSPQTAWEQAGRRGMSPDAWFSKHCTATPLTFLGREASRLTCDGGRATLWIDRQTGMLLKTDETPTIREVGTLVLRPALPAGVFAVTAPAGANVKWSGTGPAPSAYATKPGAAVTRTVRLRGLYAAALVATDDALWVAAPASEREHAPTWLQRIDAATGAVTAKVRAPAGAWALSYGAGTLWVGVSQGGNPGPSYVLPLDPRTGRQAGARLAVARSGGDGMAGLAATPEALWFATGLAQMPLPDGGAWPRQRLARISLPDRRITMFDLRGTVSTLTSGFGSVWAAEEVMRWHTSNIDAVSRIDPESGRVEARFVLPTSGGVAGIAVSDRYVYLTAFRTNTPSAPSDEYQTVLFAVDPGTNRVVATRPAYGRMVWADGALLLVDSLHGLVQRLDPVTLRPVARVQIGGTPTSAVAADPGVVWVLDAGAVKLSRVDVAAMR